uniref:Uncharacterized protein AlNc14C435G11617 n=1 Tax=Albugo laibachii Nc14 TaxID=890382 RepID=F0WZM5_9STRA|nr:conserved hypothetical protein [Albugo laibachii Nc14]|eukprot:CCA26950.1 conserved hypothetical protein [Albugo laibachii Nc14]
MSKHDISKLTTKFVRQTVEKDVHVSLNNHKEVLKRLMHHELRKIRAQKVAKRVVPAPWRLSQRRESVKMALDYIYRNLTCDSSQFDAFSLHAIQFFHDIQIVENGEIQEACVLYARLLSSLRLRSERFRDFRWDPDSVPSPEQVVELIRSVFTLERVGLAHVYRSPLLSFFDKLPPAFSSMHYLGWSPSLGPPSSSDPEKSIYDQIAQAILLTYFARALNISIGCSITQVFQYIPDFYPYKSHAELSNSEYRSQFHLIFLIVMVVTDFGALRCDQEILPHEYHYLRSQIPQLVVRQDFALLGEASLKCFPGSDHRDLVRRASAMLLTSQQDDGSWRSVNENDMQETYHTTMSALTALIEPRWTGFAPSIPEVTSLLETNLSAIIESITKNKNSLRPSKYMSSPSRNKTRPSGGFGPHPKQISLDARLSHDTRSNTATSLKRTNSDSSSSNSSKSVQSTHAHTASSHPDLVPQEDLGKQITSLQCMLTDAGDVKNILSSLAIHVLKKLSGMTLNVEVLKSTGVGRIISKLKKHKDGEVSRLAQILIKKWKRDFF